VSTHGRSDGELLAEFCASGESAPFEELLLRHGKLVTGACRRVLGDAHLADDAAQAVFLTLAHKAAALRGRASIAGWLHHVALNVSLRARQAESRRKAHEREAGEMTKLKPGADELRRAALNLLDGELDDLPENYRMALMLHHLEGNTVEQAAARLKCPTGTVAAWLSRGREILRERLDRKGVVLSVAMLTALFDEEFALRELPENFVKQTTHAAVLAAAGHAAGELLSPQAAQMTEGALRSMFLEKLKFASMSIAALVMVGICGFLAAHASESRPEPGNGSPVASIPVTAGASNSKPPAASARLAASIEALASATPAERLAAERELRNAGQAARALLTSAMASPAAEVRARAARLIARLDAEPVLQKIDAAIAGIKTVEMDFTFTTTARETKGHWAGNFQDLSRYRIQMNREKVTDVAELAWCIFDGKTEWKAFGGADDVWLQKALIQTTAKSWVWPLVSARFMENLRAYYDATSIVDSECNGKPAVTLTFTRIETETASDPAQKPTALSGDFYLTAQIQIQAPKDDMIPREWQFRDETSKVFRGRSVTNLKLNPQLDEATFKFVPPADEEVLDMGVETDENPVPELKAAPAEKKNKPANPVDF
jgi:RNA polymerase sigma factor (sigma-70 family)